MVAGVGPDGLVLLNNSSTSRFASAISPRTRRARLVSGVRSHGFFASHPPLRASGLRPPKSWIRFERSARQIR
jgi:hypothetical protein